jgi:hypothetical protein
VTITATLTGVSGTASLGVTSNNATVTSIVIDPVNPSLAVGQNQQFFANANYSDGTMQDVTATASWSSSSIATATVETAGQQQPGNATGVAVGTASITASTGGKSGSTTLTVIQSSGNGQKIPLMDMTASQNYLSFAGGLYENSTDTVPSDHDADGRSIAGQIQPLDTNGNPSSHGTILFTSIGMSNAADEFGLFLRRARTDGSVYNAKVVILNGGYGGITTCDWVQPNGNPPCSQHTENQYDRVRDRVFAGAGVTERQVQAVWIKEANGGPGVRGCGPNRFEPCRPLCDPKSSGCRNDPAKTEALRFESQLGQIIRAAKQRWPNLKLAFISTRIYAGYSNGPVSPEPFAYEYGFSAKWLIAAQIKQSESRKPDEVAGNLDYASGSAPWIDWGPYIWADGATPRADGLAWCDGQQQAPCNGEMDFQQDGMHPNSRGSLKVADLLLHFFLTSPFTAQWFAASSGGH